MVEDQYSGENLSEIFKNRKNSAQDAKRFKIYYGWMGIVPENEVHAIQIFQAKWGLDIGNLAAFTSLRESGRQIPPAVDKQFNEMLRGTHKSGITVTAQFQTKFDGDSRKVPANKLRLDQRNTLIIAEFRRLDDTGQLKKQSYSVIAEIWNLSPDTIRKIVSAGSEFYPPK